MPDRQESQAGGASRDVARSSPARGSRDARESLRDSLLVTRVEGMHCHRCEEAIVKAVSALPGVREVEVDFATGQASVIFDARKLAGRQVIAAIESAGYRCPDAGLPSDLSGDAPSPGGMADLE